MTQGDTPGMPWADIAASAYRAYAASTGGKNFRGEPMPAFDALPLAIRTAWEAAVRQAGECLKVRMDGAAPDEQRWAGFVSPGAKPQAPANVYFNGKRVEVTQARLTYEDVLRLAGQPDGASCMHDFGPRGSGGGILTRGESVAVCDGMHFSCMMTGNA